MIVPALWSLIGGSAAFNFGISEDYGLIVAGVLGSAGILIRNRRLDGVATPGDVAGDPGGQPTGAPA